MAKKLQLPPAIKKMFSEAGRQGGMSSKRSITPEQQAEMQKARRAALRRKKREAAKNR